MANLEEKCFIELRRKLKVFTMSRFEIPSVWIISKRTATKGYFILFYLYSFNSSRIQFNQWWAMAQVLLLSCVVEGAGPIPSSQPNICSFFYKSCIVIL